MSQKFVIVGGGLSGLTKAFYIKNFFPKAHITLVEQSNRVGGMMQSNLVDGFTCEEGPRSIRIGSYNRPLFYMIDKIGLYSEFIPSHQQPYSYLYWDGKLNAVPQKLNLSTIEQFLKDNGTQEVFELAKGVLKFQLGNSGKSDQFGQFFEEKFGSKITQKYVETIFFGIYGESIYNLSKSSCFDKIHMKQYREKEISKDLELGEEFLKFSSTKLKQTNSYRFIYGLESLPKRIQKYLIENCKENYNQILSTKAKAIDISKKELIVEQMGEMEQKSIPYDHLILTVPTFQMSQLMANSYQEEISKTFRNIVCNSLITRNICWDQSILPSNFQGFGYLINPRLQQNILGMVADSLSFPQQYPKNSTSLSIMSLYDVKDDVILSELSNHLGVKIPDPKNIITKSWSKAFTQFAPGHYEKMKKIEQELLEKNITIGANNYTLAIPEIVYLSYSKMKQLQK